MSQAHLSNGTPPRHWVIIPAAGVGKRMQAHCPKQYLPFNGRTILEQTLSVFIDDGQFERVYLGLSAGDPYWPELALSGHTKISVFEGGDERVDTVYQGLLAMADLATEDDFVWVHDAARPCLSQADIQALTEALEHSEEGALLAVKINDTVKRSTDAGLCETTVDREYLWRAMTPQVFRYQALKQALESCFEHQVFVTDDASAMEFVGAQPRLVAGSDHNIKITRPEDLANAEQYYQKMTAHEESPMIPRIGSGYDVHAFEEGEFVTIGGVQIPHTHGLKAHSDGDVLLHALADALLGALALGDIGKHFPDTDEKWKGADSRMLLRGVFDLIQEKGYEVGNVDLTVIAQAPKMAPHIEAIQANIADDLKLDVSCVGVKATTTEKLGFTGRKEGIAAQASALLFPAAGKPGN